MYGKLSRNEGDISTQFLPLSVDFFLYINMGMCFCLLYLIKIFKMAAELYRGVLLLSILLFMHKAVWANIAIRIAQYDKLLR